MRVHSYYIFGNPVLFEEGLVDADANSLDAEFEALKSVWDERECALSNCSQPQFHSWFRAHSLELDYEGNFQCALYGVMANTVNFSTPGPPPLPHFSPESTGLPPYICATVTECPFNYI